MGEEHKAAAPQAVGEEHTAAATQAVSKEHTAAVPEAVGGDYTAAVPEATTGTATNTNTAAASVNTATADSGGTDEVPVAAAGSGSINEAPATVANSGGTGEVHETRTSSAPDAFTGGGKPAEISKKELLAQTGISYGQLYRWKREGLIPESWFDKRSAFTGQETFFVRDRILERIAAIQGMKDAFSLSEIRNRLEGCNGRAGLKTALAAEGLSASLLDALPLNYEQLILTVQSVQAIGVLYAALCKSPASPDASARLIAEAVCTLDVSGALGATNAANATNAVNAAESANSANSASSTSSTNAANSASSTNNANSTATGWTSDAVAYGQQTPLWEG